MSELSSIALDAGWYADPYGAAVERYHDGAAWTGRIRLPGSTTEIVEPQVEMRSAALRGLLTTGAVLVVLALFIGATGVSIAYGYPYSLVVLLFFVGWFLFVGLAGPKAGYTAPYAFLVFIPAVGVVIMAVLTAKIVNRRLMLPYRTYEVQQHEAAMWLQIRDPKRPGGLLYIRRTW